MTRLLKPIDVIDRRITMRERHGKPSPAPSSGEDKPATSFLANVTASISAWCRDTVSAWDDFWFTPQQPHTLALIRILAGAMLFYTHLIWSIDLMAFVGPNSWLTSDVVKRLNPDSFVWSHLFYIESPAVLWGLHVIALGIFAMLTAGLFTRVTSILAAVITISYCHRLNGALFGLDQVNAMLAVYLAIGHCGSAYSIDRLLSRREGRGGDAAQGSTANNLAIRLIQVHMCIIYLFGGIGKMRGEMWWDGSAFWYAIANYEYQSIDMTWMVRFPFFIALLTHLTVFWETFYPFLIWSRRTRPITLMMAVLVHGGIAIFLGMPTFGLAMLIGNLAFVSPDLVKRFLRDCE